MRSQLSATCFTIPNLLAGSVLSSSSLSHVSLLSTLRHKKWAMHVQGKQVSPHAFAALNVAVQSGQLAGDLNKDVRGEQGLVSSVGTPAPSLVSLQDWYFADKQFVVISCSAFATAGLMTLLLAAAIPSLLAIKKAAEALEKLADTAREELPGTMGAIRLSGMEISDLTMELNDLGQEISRGVRSSARALNAAESGMRQVGGLASNGRSQPFRASLSAAEARSGGSNTSNAGNGAAGGAHGEASAGRAGANAGFGWQPASCVSRHQLDRGSANAHAHAGQPFPEKEPGILNKNNRPSPEPPVCLSIVFEFF